MPRLDLTTQCTALILVALLHASSATAQVSTEASAPERSATEQKTGDAVGALPGIMRVGVATPLALGGAVSAFAGYGFLGDILGLEDSHHRAAGQLSATLRLADWFGFGVRFDGRYDRHSSTDGSDDGYVGDPRIIARVTREVGAGLNVAGQANIWLPGSDAPSLIAGAISAEAIGMVSYRLPSAPLTVSGNLGFRLDNSAEAVDDPMQLSLADRLALGLSDSNAVLAGAGLSYRSGPAEVLLETTFEYLIGDDAPPPSRSPLEAAAGVRYHIADNLQFQVYGRARLAKDPIIRAESPLIAVSPRFGAMAGLHLQFGGPEPAEKPLITDGGGDGDGDDDDDDDNKPVAPATVAGKVISGGAPISDAKVSLTVGDDVREATTSADGDYSFDEVAGDAEKVTLTVEVDGFKKATSEVSITAGASAQHDIELERILPPGSIKAVVRDFRGQPVIAKVTVYVRGSTDPLTTVSPQSDGSFSVSVAPGEYEVVVEHKDYRTQRKQVRVAKGTVTILNIDMQKP